MEPRIKANQHHQQQREPSTSSSLLAAPIVADKKQQPSPPPPQVCFSNSYHCFLLEMIVLSPPKQITPNPNLLTSLFSSLQFNQNSIFNPMLDMGSTRALVLLVS